MNDEEPLQYLFVVMEYVSSDLKKVLNDADKMGLEKDHVITILYNSLCCLNFIHSANIIHRDIKSANILMDDECRAKICDFGLARTNITNPYADMENYVKERLPLHSTSSPKKMPKTPEKKFMNRRN